MSRDETPTTIAPSEDDRDALEGRMLDVAERLLAQLTDDEWAALLNKLHETRRRKRPFQFDQRIGYFV